MMTVDHVEVGISKRPDGSRNIAIAFHDPHLGLRLHPLTIQEAQRLRDALGRAIEIMGAAVMVAKIATGELENKLPEQSAAAELGRKGGKARAEKLSEENRHEIAKKAAAKRWTKR